MLKYFGKDTPPVPQVVCVLATEDFFLTGRHLDNVRYPNLFGGAKCLNKLISSEVRNASTCTFCFSSSSN